jgi:hypothetical protein
MRKLERSQRFVNGVDVLLAYSIEEETQMEDPEAQEIYTIIDSLIGELFENI